MRPLISRFRRNQRILQDIKRNLEAVLAGHSLQDNADEESDEELVAVKDNEAAEGCGGVLPRINRDSC